VTTPICPCGGIILADTENWKVPRCFDCWHALGEPPVEPRLFILPVTPSGTTRSAVMVPCECGCGPMVEYVPTYPPSPRGQALRDARLAAGFSMGQLSRALGIRVSAVSDLERGRNTTDGAGWAAIYAALGVEESK
jgi:hypothetical protein